MKKLMTICLLTTALCGTAFADTIWSEDFSTYANGTTNGTAGKWSIDVSDCVVTVSTDYFQVEDNTMEALDLDGEAIWTSESISISGEDSVSVSIDVWESGSLDPEDHIKLYYKLDGGAETLFETNGDNSDDFNSATASQTGLTGSTLQLVIRVFNNVGTEYINFDNIVVSSGALANSAPVLAAIGDQAVIVSNELSFTVSATDVNGDDIVLSATGLPSGAVFNTVTNAGAVTNTFTWASATPTGTWQTVFTAADAETNTSETITITVSEQPVLPDNVTFDFADDADLYGALDDQTGPITYTNNGLVTTFTASDGEMNRTTTGFGINGDTISGDDTDAFDNNEWIDITFTIPVVLTNINTASWTTNDTAVIYVNGTSNGVIAANSTTTFDTAFELIIPADQVLRIAATNGIFPNGWHLESISVRTDTNPPPVANSLPILNPIGSKYLVEGSALNFTVSATDADNNEIILSVSNLPSGAVFNTVTNAGSVSNTFSWAAPTAGTYTPSFIADDGTTNASETITITVIEQPLLMISEVADPNGTGGGDYRFVELYNAGTNTIDLTAGSWTLSMQDNGDTNDWRDVALTGSIGPTGTYVVANTASNFLAAYGFSPDLANTGIDGNGRDAYILYYGGDHAAGTLIDIYGEVDVDGIGTAWYYDNDRAERNNSILEPNTTWTASEWTLTVNAETNEFNPGIHGPTPEFTPIPEDQMVLLGNDLSLIVTAVNTVKTDVITLSASVLPAGATFPTEIGTNTVTSTLGMIAPTAGVYTVTFAADGDVDTMYATIEVLVVDLDADNDGDGVTNGDELIAGTDMNSAFSIFQITDHQIDTNGQNTVTWNDVAGRRYTVLWTSSLLDGFQPVATNDAPTDSWTDINHTTEPKSFYQLEVQLIP